MIAQSVSSCAARIYFRSSAGDYFKPVEPSVFARKAKSLRWLYQSAESRNFERSEVKTLNEIVGPRCLNLAALLRDVHFSL